MSPTPTDSIRLRVPRILWGAMFASTCVFIVVLYFQQRTGALPTEPTEPIMLPAFAAVALGIAIVSVLYPRHLHRTSLELGKLEVVTEVDERGGAALFRDAAPTIRVFANPDEARRSAFVKYNTPFILGMAQSESIALFGFALGMLGFPLLHVLPFWLVCWVLMIIRFPTLERILGPLEKAHDAVFK